MNNDQYFLLRSCWSSRTRSLISRGQLCVLPPELRATCFIASIFGRGCTNSPDSIGWGPKFMCSHMRYCHGLAHGTGCLPCCAGCLSRSGIGSECCLPSLTRCDFASCPRTCLFNCYAWTAIIWSLLLEKMKHMLSTISRPLRNKTMIRVSKRSTSTYGYKPKVPSLFKNDLLVHNKPLMQNIILGELMIVFLFVVIEILL